VNFDVIIIGAGAAGLMCAATAAQRGRSVLLLEHTSRIGEKIRISGGGRCNFTNIHCSPDKYLSDNPHFCKSALKRYTQFDFIDLVRKHKIRYHEKTLGQLFCDETAKDIIDMLLAECAEGNVIVKTGITVTSIKKESDSYDLETTHGCYSAPSLVISCGGLSIPKIGATPFGYEIARQFGHAIIPTRAGLVPLVFDPIILEQTRALSGVSVDPGRARAACGMSFDEAMLFTHRGISGPVILQISSYWQPGQAVTLSFLPNLDMMAWLKTRRTERPKQNLLNNLAEILPRRVAEWICADGTGDQRMADMSDKALQKISDLIQNWAVIPSGSEGYRTAEVTLGGVDTREVSSKTFESNLSPGLYFIGEVLDVTGHLGGYNFQWAWSSGWCAGQSV